MSDNQDALRCANNRQKIARNNGGIGSVFISQKSLMESSAHIRRLVAENEAKDALLKQALEALETDAWQKKLQAAINIRQHLAPQNNTIKENS